MVEAEYEILYGLCLFGIPKWGNQTNKKYLRYLQQNEVFTYN